MNRAFSLCLHTPRDKELTTPWLSQPSARQLKHLERSVLATDRDVGPLSLSPHWDPPVKIYSIFCEMVLGKEMCSRRSSFPSHQTQHSLSSPFSTFVTNVCHQCCHYSQHFDNSYHFLSTYWMPGTASCRIMLKSKDSQSGETRVVIPASELIGGMNLSKLRYLINSQVPRV